MEVSYSTTELSARYAEWGSNPRDLNHWISKFLKPNSLTTRTSAYSEKQNPMRCSICPVMVYEGCAFLLLGRSRNMKSWVEGSSLWDDFGGRLKDQEAPEECAARELYEETLGLLISRSDIPLLAQSIRDEQYVIRMQNTFLVKFDWNPKILFDFSKLHFQLKCFEKLCGMFPLTAAQRLEMCKFKWMQSRSDTNLRAVLEHPALEISKRPLPACAIQNAHSKLAEMIHAKPSSAYGPATTCVVVHGVKTQFLEKEVLELFSLEQLFCCLQNRGLCVRGQSIQLNAAFSDFLQNIKVSTCMGLADCPDCEEKCEC